MAVTPIIMVRVTRSSRAASASKMTDHRSPPSGISSITTSTANAAQRKIQQRKGRYDLTQIDQPREIPEARTGHEQLGGKDAELLNAAAARRARGVKFVCYAGAHPTLASRSQLSRPRRRPVQGP